MWILSARLAVSVVLCLMTLTCAYAGPLQGQGAAHNRRLHDIQNSDTTLQYIDLSSIPTLLPEGNGTIAEERPLQNNINITTDAINQPYDVQEGAFHLGPFEVQQIMDAVTSQLVCFDSWHRCTHAQCPFAIACQSRSYRNHLSSFIYTCVLRDETSAVLYCAEATPSGRGWLYDSRALHRLRVIT